MNINELILHPLTRQHMKQLLQAPPHALLLSGELGSGTLTAATAIAESIAEKSSLVHVISPDEKGTITIETVRELYVQTRGRQQSNKVFLIDTAEAMGVPAQNAFLKLLEEPGDNIVFILTSHDTNALLPTILSRLQHIELRRIGRQESMEILRQNGVVDSALLAQLLFIGEGLPAELLRLAQDEAYRAAKIGQASIAKQFLMGSRYERLVLAGSLAAKPRQDILHTLRIAVRIMRAQLRKSQDNAILEAIDSLLLADEKISHNGHARTQLMRTIK